MVIDGWARGWGDVVAADPLTIRLPSGAVVVFEIVAGPLPSAEWVERHGAHVASGVVDVWLWPLGVLPWVVAEHGLPIWYLDGERGRFVAKVARPHQRPSGWHRGDLSVYAPHLPACAHDACDDLGWSLAEVGLGADGLEVPASAREWLDGRQAEVAAQARVVREREERQAAAAVAAAEAEVAAAEAWAAEKAERAAGAQVRAAQARARAAERARRDGPPTGGDHLEAGVKRCVVCGFPLDPFVYPDEDDERHIIC